MLTLHIASHPNDRVLDTFLGSVTTAAFTYEIGRHWIGIEMGKQAATAQMDIALT